MGRIVITFLASSVVCCTCVRLGVGNNAFFARRRFVWLENMLCVNLEGKLLDHRLKFTFAKSDSPSTGIGSLEVSGSSGPTVTCIRVLIRVSGLRMRRIICAHCLLSTALWASHTHIALSIHDGSSKGTIAPQQLPSNSTCKSSIFFQQEA